MPRTLPADSSENNSLFFSNTSLQIVLVIVVAIPLLALPSTPGMQGVANRVLQIMVALLAGLIVWRNPLTLRPATHLKFLGTSANLPILLFFGSALLSLFLGPTAPPLRRLGLLEVQRLLAGVLLYFALASQNLSTKQWDKIINTLIWIAGTIAFLGLGAQVTQSAQTRADLFGNPQLYGAFLMILFPLVLMRALTEPIFLRRVTAQVISILVIMGLFMSGLRSAWLSTLVMLLALALFSLLNTASRHRMSQFKRQYAIPLLTLLVCCVFATLQGDALRMITIRLNAGDSSLEARQKYWHAARQLYKEKPLIGVGLGMYPVLQFKYSGVGRPGDAVLQTRPGLSEMAHNLWWKIAAEQGLVGIVLFGSIIASFLISGLRRLSALHDPIRRSMLMAALASVVGFSIDAFSNPGWEFIQIGLFFWLMMGLGTASMQESRPRMETAQ